MAIFSPSASARTGFDAGVDGDDVVDGVDVDSTEEDTEEEEGEGGLSHVVSPVPPNSGSLK